MTTFACFWTFLVLGWMFAQLIVVAVINAFIKDPDRALIVYGLTNSAFIFILIQIIERFTP